MRSIMVVGLAGAFIAHRTLAGLIEIVESVRAGDPFVLENAERLHSIAWWQLGARLLHLLVGALAGLPDADGIHHRGVLPWCRCVT
jgi:hypothetical protein